MDYRTIPMPISEPCLDSDNPRLSRTGMDEKSIMQELFDEEEVIDIVKSICRLGYLPDASLLAVKRDDNKYVVVDGNRRLCALKLLAQPSLLPSKKEARIRNIIDAVEDPQIVKEVPVTITSEEDADIIIMSRHTATSVKKWGRINQARFYRRLVNRKQSVANISRKHDIMPSKVKKSLQLEQLYLKATEMPLGKDVLAIVNDQKKFKLSTLERIAQTKRFRELLGVSFTTDVKIKISIPDDEFVAMYKEIVSDMASKDIDTRKLNNKEEIEYYLNNLCSLGKSGAKLGTKSSTKLGTKSSTKPGAKKGTRSPRYFLVPDDVPYKLVGKSLKNLFNELQKNPPIDTHPNMVAIAFRCFLEMSIRQYLVEKKLMKDLQKKKSPNGEMIGLKVLLKYLEENQEDCDIDKNALQSARKALNSGRDKVFSVHSLNALVHNQDFSINAEGLKIIVDNFDGLVRAIIKGGKK